MTAGETRTGINEMAKHHDYTISDHNIPTLDSVDLLFGSPQFHFSKLCTDDGQKVPDQCGVTLELGYPRQSFRYLDKLQSHILIQLSTRIV